MGAEFHRDNHYVPRSYLKRWSHDGARLWTYRVLVSHDRVPLWREASLRGIAYHEHLYTKIAASGESDDIERWLDAEFETPAEPVIERVVTDRRLSAADWTVLIRFFAAQDVRTPARLVENLRRWSDMLPDLIQNTLTDSITRLQAMSSEERAELAVSSPAPEDGLPFRVTIERDAEHGGGWATGEVVSGRGMWLWSIQQALTNTIRALLRHKWTILSPPTGLTWLTSDDPAIKLNFTSATEYTFGGGWGSVGTDLLLPLGPRHLLFTQIGKPVPPRGTVVDWQKATLMQRLIAEHAHRYLFSVRPDPLVEAVRPRHVNAAELKREAREWQQWHAAHSQAERDLLDSSDKSPNDR